MARGVRHGPDRASIREPVATLAHDVHHAIDPDQHFIARCRQLAAATLGYRVEGPPRFGLVPPPPAAGTVPDRPFVVFIHGTSRPDKLWPDEHWRCLTESFATAGLAVLLPWGSDAERARSERYAAGVANARVPPPPRLTLPALASLLARAEIAIGVDTGLLHLAAALGTPTLSLFVATDPMRCGVGPAGAHARDLGGVGRVPSPAAAERAAGELIRRAPRC
jgi:heptosyltransferase-1